MVEVILALVLISSTLIGSEIWKNRKPLYYVNGLYLPLPNSHDWTWVRHPGEGGFWVNGAVWVFANDNKYLHVVKDTPEGKNIKRVSMKLDGYRAENYCYAVNLVQKQRLIDQGPEPKKLEPVQLDLMS